MRTSRTIESSSGLFRRRHLRFCYSLGSSDEYSVPLLISRVHKASLQRRQNDIV